MRRRWVTLVLAGVILALSATKILGGDEMVRMYVGPLNGAPALYMDGKPLAALLGSPQFSNVKIEKGALRLHASQGSVTEVFSRTELPASFTLSADLAMTTDSFQGGNVSLATYSRSAPQGRYVLFLGLTSAGNRIILQKETSGRPTATLLDRPYPWEFDRAVHLVMKIADGVLTVRADENELGSVKDPEPLDLGRIRLGVYSASGAFDNVRVQTADGKDLLTDDFNDSERSAEIWGIPLAGGPSFADIGIHLYTAVCGDLREAWKGPDNYDWTAVDRYLESLVRMDPSGYLLARFQIRAPKWWLESHPDDVMTCILRETNKTIKQDAPSFSSERWRRDASAALRSFLQHLRATPNGHRIVGMTLFSGMSGEWTYSWGTDFHDYSPVQVAGFRAWLRKKYSTDEKLRAAWNDERVSFETAAIPTPNRRAEGDFFEFFDPAKGRQVPDYMRYHSEVVASLLTHFAQLVKEETNGRMFTAAFYGYHFPQYSHYHDMGHNDLASVLRCPYLDSLCSPHAYQNRQAGGVTSAVQPIASIRLHGKLWFDEDDTRTHLAPANASYGRTQDLWDSVNVLKRNFAYALSKSTGLWHMDWGWGWLRDPAIMETIAANYRLAEQALIKDKDRRPKAEMAVVISERTLDYLRSSFGIVRTLYKAQYHDQMSRVGAPFDVLLTSDLANAPEYRFYVFLDTFYLAESEKSVIRDRVLRDNHTVLWLFGPAFVTDSGLSDESTSELTGMKIRAYNGGGRLRLTLCDVGHPITRGIPPGLQFETLDDTGPIFYVEDRDARVLGMTDVIPVVNSEGKYQSGSEILPGFAVKEMTGWRSVWCGVPNLPACLLRNIARAAGVHIYDDGDDFVCANDFMLSVHARYAGVRRLMLPQPSTVTDAYTGKKVAEHVSEFEVFLERNETGLWLLD